MLRLRHLLFSVALTVLTSGQAAAFTGETLGVVGVMQQPTSHYYHLIYGGSVGFGTDSEGLLLRASYIERPEFRSVGYADKDYGWFGLIGTKVTKQPGHGIYAYLGAGHMAGYTKTTTSSYQISPPSTTYDVVGPIVSVEYRVYLGHLELAACHQVFVGYVDRSQLSGYVGWPYSFFEIHVGAKL